MSFALTLRNPLFSPFPSLAEMACSVTGKRERRKVRYPSLTRERRWPTLTFHPFPPAPSTLRFPLSLRLPSRTGYKWTSLFMLAVCTAWQVLRKKESPFCCVSSAPCASFPYSPRRRLFPPQLSGAQSSSLGRLGRGLLSGWDDGDVGSSPAGGEGEEEKARAGGVERVAGDARGFCQARGGRFEGDGPAGSTGDVADGGLGVEEGGASRLCRTSSICLALSSRSRASIKLTLFRRTARRWTSCWSSWRRVGKGQ